MTQWLKNNNPANQMTTPVRILNLRCQKHYFKKIFILAAQGFGCSMWDLLPQPGTKPGLLHQEYGVLATGPPGKSPKSTIFIAFSFEGFFSHFYFSDRKTTIPITKVMTSCLTYLGTLLAICQLNKWVNILSQITEARTMTFFTLSYVQGDKSQVLIYYT